MKLPAKRIGVGLVLMTAALLLSSCLQPDSPSSIASAGDWPQWRYDAGRGAVTPDALPAALHLQWVRQLPTPRPAWPPSQPTLRFDVSYAAVAAGKMLFVPSMVTDSVTAYDTETGVERWRFYTDGPVRFAPIAFDGKVCFASDDGFLYCVDATDGTLLWRFRGGPYERRGLGNERLISSWPIRGGPVLHDGVIYFTAGIWPFMGIFVHAVDATSGETVWTNSGAGSTYTTQPHGSPAFAGLVPRGHLAATQHGLVVPGGRTRPGCYDLKTGEFRHFEFGGKSDGGFHVTARDKWFFLSGSVQQIDDGKKIDGVCPILHDDRTLYGLQGGRLHAQSPQTELVETTTKDRKGDVATVKKPTLKQEWNISLGKFSGKLFLKAGPRFYAGGDGTVTAYTAQPRHKEADVVWSAKIDGQPWTMLAADKRLFVITVEGSIYCFGEKAGEPTQHAMATTSANSADANPWQAFAEGIVRSAKATGGYGIVLGLGSGRLAEALLDASKLRLIVVDPDAKKIDAFRRRMDAAGLYGLRVSAHVGNPVEYRFPPYMAQLIVSEDPESAGLVGSAEAIGSVFAALRPYGGTACLPIPLEQLRKPVEQAGLEQARLRAAGKSWSVLVREGALPGAADWTHNYADAGNSVVSADRRTKAPLGLLWFGGPSNDDMLPRHGHGPSPLVAGGRLFIEGPDMLRALDIYTGRLLWQRLLPGLGTYYDNTSHQAGAGEIGSNYVALEDAVYVVYGSKILELDSATGRTKRQFALESTRENPKPNWGYIGASGDLLVATSTPVVPTEKPSPAKTASTSVSDAAAGYLPLIRVNEQWQYLAGSDPVGDWTAPGYAATDWKMGGAGFGYGDGDDRTVFDDMKDRYTRVYIRRTFDGAAAEDATAMVLKINYDDGFIAYLNGKEVARAEVQRGRGKDATGIGQHEAKGYETFAIEGFRDLLLPGKNVLAIEGHNVGADSGDFSLDPYVLIAKPGDTKEPPTVAMEPGTLGNQWTSVRYGSASRRLVVIDRKSGKELWSRPAKFGFRHNGIALGDGKLFCIDAISRAKQKTLQRLGKSPADYAPRLLALDMRSGNEIWSTDEDVFGTFLNYSAEHKILLQAGSAARDRASDESAAGMVAYRASDGNVVWKDLSRYFGGPCMLHHDTIIMQDYVPAEGDKIERGTHPLTGQPFSLRKSSVGKGMAISLLTGEPKLRKHPITGASLPWTYKRNYGCNTVIGSEHLLTFRSAAAGFYDLATDGGTGNLGGFKSGCTSNLIVAGGLLNAPEYTRTCTCRYQNQTSLAMVHDPNVELWTFNAFEWDGAPVRRVGINFGAPGDRMADNGTLWLDYPSTGGPSPNIPVEIEADNATYFRRHSSEVRAEQAGGELAWVTASGVEGPGSVTLTLATGPTKPRKYTVRLHFAEVEDLAASGRVFDVLLQGKKVLSGFNITEEAGGVNHAIVKEFQGIEAADRLKVSLVADDQASSHPPVLSGIEVTVEGP
ncbi:MAG: PQQ-binding-like beta-propeller repeat protein [Thermoguttaceae bacterium]